MYLYQLNYPQVSFVFACVKDNKTKRTSKLKNVNNYLNNRFLLTILQDFTLLIRTLCTIAIRSCQFMVIVAVFSSKAGSLNRPDSNFL